MKIKPLFAWYDLWIGAFVDRAKRRIYIFPVPCVGFYIEWSERIPKSEWAMCRMIELGSHLDQKQAKEMSQYFHELSRDREGNYA